MNSPTRSTWSFSGRANGYVNLFTNSSSTQSTIQIETSEPCISESARLLNSLIIQSNDSINSSSANCKSTIYKTFNNPVNENLRKILNKTSKFKITSELTDANEELEFLINNYDNDLDESIKTTTIEEINENLNDNSLIANNDKIININKTSDKLNNIMPFLKENNNCDDDSDDDDNDVTNNLNEQNCAYDIEECLLKIQESLLCIENNLLCPQNIENSQLNKLMNNYELPTIINESINNINTNKNVNKTRINNEIDCNINIKSSENSSTQNDNNNEEMNLPINNNNNITNSNIKVPINSIFKNRRRKNSNDEILCDVKRRKISILKSSNIMIPDDSFTKKSNSNYKFNDYKNILKFKFKKRFKFNEKLINIGNKNKSKEEDEDDDDDVSVGNINNSQITNNNYDKINSLDDNNDRALIPSKLLSLSFSILLAALLQAVRCLADIIEDTFKSVGFDKYRISD